MLRSVVLVALAAGAFVVVRKRRNAQADAALWREATSTRCVLASPHRRLVAGT